VSPARVTGELSTVRSDAHLDMRFVEVVMADPSRWEPSTSRALVCWRLWVLFLVGMGLPGVVGLSAQSTQRRATLQLYRLDAARENHEPRLR